MITELTSRTPSQAPEFDLSLTGTVAKGYGHASGSAKYPEGTINLQKIAFLKHGLDIRMCFSGTINLSIAPSTYEVAQPEFILKGVEWKSGRIPENFFIGRALIITNGQEIPAYVYLPDPTTKTGSTDNPQHLQLLAPFIEGLHTGAALTVKIRSKEFVISAKPKQAMSTLDELYELEAQYPPLMGTLPKN